MLFPLVVIYKLLQLKKLGKDEAGIQHFQNFLHCTTLIDRIQSLVDFERQYPTNCMSQSNSVQVHRSGIHSYFP